MTLASLRALASHPPKSLLARFVNLCELAPVGWVGNIGGDGELIRRLATMPCDGRARCPVSGEVAAAYIEGFRVSLMPSGTFIVRERNARISCADLGQVFALAYARAVGVAEADGGCNEW